jgi:hypothetical protein
MLKSGRLVPGGVLVFLVSFFLASSSIAAGPDWGAPGGAIPPARPGSLNAVPDPKLRAPLTQTAPAAPAAPETVLTTKGFAFASSMGAPDTEVVQFRVPGPGKVILEASNTGTRLDKLGLIARAPKPPGQSPVDTRWDGPTPLRVEFPVTAQDLANLAPQGNVWTVFITLRGPNGVLYAIPGLAAVGSLKVSFVASAPAQKTALEPKAMPNLGTARPGSGVFPAGTPQEVPVKAAQPALKTSQPAPAEREYRSALAFADGKIRSLRETAAKFHGLSREPIPSRLGDAERKKIVEYDRWLQGAAGRCEDLAMKWEQGVGRIRARGEGGGAQSEFATATKEMQEMGMSFNLQYLQLQNQMQNENRSYTAVSNIMKTKHDTVKNSINNIR